MPIASKKRVVIDDVNLWISFLIDPEKNRILLDALDLNDFRFLVCPELLTELKEVASREKFRKFFEIQLAEDLLEVLENKCENITIENKSQPILRDPKDAYLLNLAEQGKANILVSGDKDILSLKGQIGNLEIMSLTEFKILCESKIKMQNRR